MISVFTISALSDNYIYLCKYSQKNAFVVDPAQAAAAQQHLEEHQLNLTHILITHHHFDHTGGLRELKKRYACQVISPDSRKIAGTDRAVKDADILRLDGVEIKVIATPGHTATGVCYYLPISVSNAQPIVFTGDTLFIAGCGRLLECDAETMWRSLQRLVALPDQTLVYCGHDYTEDNLEFALSIEPDNKDATQALQEVRLLHSQGKPTVPSSISREKLINPFLRVIDWQSFAELRHRKDLWG